MQRDLDVLVIGAGACGLAAAIAAYDAGVSAATLSRRWIGQVATRRYRSAPCRRPERDSSAKLAS